MPPKRKRGSGDPGGGRPSPHRPDQTMMGQRERGYQDGPSRGGRGGRNTRRSDRRDSAQDGHGASTSASSSAQANAPPPSARRPSSSSSQTIPPPTTFTPAPNAPLSAPPAVPVPSNYIYTIVTDDRVSTWPQSGRQAVVDYGVQSRNDLDATEVSIIYQELLRSVLDSRLGARDAGLVVKEMIGELDDETPSFDPRVTFLDSISIVLDVEENANRPHLRDFMIATDISPMLMRQILDHEFLMRLGFLRETFQRMSVRYSTNLLYRQQSYNLLREETEGFSKLVTELYTSSAGPDFSFEMAHATFERVKGLIGTFDLDVGRVLDITLDVFAATIIKQFKFFVKFLRISSWWPRSRAKHSDESFLEGLPRWAQPELPDNGLSEEDDEALVSEERRKRDVEFWDRARQIQIDAYFQLGGREVADENLLRLAEGADRNLSDSNPEHQWIKTTKTVPPTGSRVAAQILGFKLRFYSSSARDPSDVLPANLLYLAALLIKIGFISLCDLYPHLWPLDADMDKVRQKRKEELLEQEKKSRTGGTANALMMAGALPDDMPPVAGSAIRRDATTTKADSAKTGTDAAAATDAPALPDPLDQKVQLLVQLLTIGAVPDALYMLGRFPWLPEMFPDLFPLIHRIILHSIHKVSKDSQPSCRAPIDSFATRIADADQTGVPKGSVKQSELPFKRPLRWPYPDQSASGDSQSYRFYFDEWIDSVPVCQTVDDIFTLCSTFLNISGVNIGRDPELLSSLARIGAKSLQDDPSQQNRDRWQDLLKRLLVPALSLTPSNSSCVDRVWTLLEQYPTAVRYNIYAEWNEGSISRLEPITRAFSHTRLETLGTMKRLSLTNISAMARTLAKTAYASPGIVFKVALDQIEAYSNLIQVFVECAKYFTPLGYDVLVWSLMSSLGGKQRSRTQETSVLLTSKWLQALSKFSGHVFKRYSVMDASPVLQYVNDQLLKGNSTDLVILKELIYSMGGLVSDVDFTDAQLQALTGGPALRRQTLISLHDKRSESARSAARLMKALVNTRMAGTLLINIAQYRQSAIYKLPEDEAHIKYLGTMVDDTHQVLVQYLDLLRSNLEPDQFDALVPNISRLMSEFGLEASLAFMIGRASLAYQMAATPKSPTLPSLGEGHSDTQSSHAVIDVDIDGDISMNGTKAPPTGSEPSAATDDKMAVDEKPPTPAASEPAANTRKNDQMLDALQPLISSVQTILPDNVWQHMAPEFYVIFWSLQLGDLSVPQARYTAEHDRLNKQAEDVMRDRSDMTRSGMNKKNEKKDALLDIAKTIRYEMLSHAERNQKTKLRLLKHANAWFSSPMASVNATADIILEQCILPRLCLSSIDTEYSFRMTKFLHENRAPNFKLMSLYERFFNPNRLRDVVFTSTVREAEHLARFIKCILGDLSRWHADKTVYEKEGLGLNSRDGRRAYLGFATAFDDDGKPQSFVEHPQFRDLLYGWHKNLNIALKDCLENSEWMHIRNAITVLKTIMEFFPAVDFMGRQFSDQLKKITDREAATKTTSESEPEHRVDLSVAAQTTFSELQRRKSKWVMVQAFRPNAAGQSQDDQKVADTPATGLRPTAAEFKPQRPAPPIKTQALPEVEDGELKTPSTANVASLPTTQGKDAAANQPVVPNMDSAKKDAGVASQSATSSKPSTPKLAPSIPVTGSVGRAESSKSSGLTSLPPIPGLPSRPDVPVPGRYTTDRYGQVRSQDTRREPQSRDPQDAKDPRGQRDPRDHREVRDSRELRESREFRTPDGRADRPPRDFSGPDRRPDNINREAGRHPERDWPSRTEPPARWPEHGVSERESRPPRDRVPPGGRGHDVRTPRDAPLATPPPHPPALQPDSRDLSNTHDRAARLVTDDRPEIINPGRAALINDGRAPNHRSARDEPRDRPSSKPDTPRGLERRNLDSTPIDRGRDDRPPRYPLPEQHSLSRDSHSQTAHPQPRERTSERDNTRSTDRTREPAFQGTSSSRHPESEHGRLGHQDPNYGRLNSIPSVTDIPSGPRGRGRDPPRGGPINGPPAGPDARFPSADTHRTASPERHPPTGPSSSRSARRGGRGQYESTSNVASPTSVGPSAGTGVHPERMGHINAPPPTSQGSTSTVPATSVSVHPDRLVQIEKQLPPPSGPSTRSNLPPLNTSDRHSIPAGPPGARSGPASLQNNPVADHRGGQATPTGPSSTNDRAKSNQQRLMRGIQDTISGGSSRRGASRGQLAGSDAQVLTGGSPVTTPIHERSDPMRRDLGGDRPSVNSEPLGPGRDGRGGNGDEQSGPSGRDHDRGRRDHRAERSSRPSRRSSRERSPEREREQKSHRDYRDRRSDGPGAAVGNARDAERDRQGPRRSGREVSSTNMEPLGGPNTRDPNREPLGSGRESRHRGEGRGDGGGRGAEERGGNGRGNRGRGPREVGPRLGEDRRDGREERGRKRQSDEGTGPLSNDREKRLRR